MKLRGLARIAAVAAACVLAGTLAAPAHAEDPVDKLPFPVLDIPEEGTFAKDFKTKGCDGVPGGAKAGIDGWVFNQPFEDVTVIGSIFGFARGPNKEDVIFLLVTEEGVVEFEPPADTEALDKAVTGLKASAPQLAADGDTPFPFPTKKPPAGVAGAQSDSGAWLQTPAGWLLGLGFLLVVPEQTPGSKFNLLRVCLPSGTSPPASATASPSGGAGGGLLPVTGTNVWIIAGTGTALILAGAVLYLLRRRRDSVKFVA